jgi:hypothetical protein
MGYLDNTSLTIDAILTKKGRELLARGDGSFRITQFSISDDEVDYSLWNESHPSGSAYYGEAIENMPLLEAFPEESQIMKYKLVTLPRGTTRLPILSIGSSQISLNLGQTTTIDPTTLNFEGLVNRKEPDGYTATIADSRLIPSLQGFGAGATASTEASQIFGDAAFARTVNGASFSIQAVSTTSLFPTGISTLSTTLTVIGKTSGARVTVPVNVTKTTA